MASDVRNTEDTEEVVPSRRISVDGGGRHFALVPHLPLLSSASQQWEGFLLERHVSDGFEVPKHSHSSILLSMQLNASLRLEWKSAFGGHNAVVDAGTLTLHGAASCNGSTWNGAYNRILFELDERHLEHLTEGKFPGAKVEIAEHWSFKDPRLEYLLKVLHDELQQGAPAGRLFGEQVGNAVAMLLAKQYSVVRPYVYRGGGRIPTSRIRKVFDYIEAHLHQDIHLSDLASTAAMSPYYFARLFKTSIGVTPHQYVIQRRIDRAKEMLRNSQMSIFEIGVRVGYADPKHFRTLFRREVGVAPNAFRAAHS
ncbi:helix-turn-helix transcriptional regulator [Edaphobacter sp. HDX4]|uniref:AraC family transcriptional regulator n=1 Tax=Edaphobacter sp. HDX4 TaxID=2794064 RepID=UPI002FE62D87